jgi:hypothetical protein
MTTYTITYTTDQNWTGTITKYDELEAELTANGLLGVLIAKGTIANVRLTVDNTLINEWEY